MLHSLYSRKSEKLSPFANTIVGYFVIFILLLISGCAVQPPRPESSAPRPEELSLRSPLAKQLELRFASGLENRFPKVLPAQLRNTGDLESAYQSNQYEAFWFSENKLKADATQMIKWIESAAEAEGLAPEDYQLSLLQGLSVRQKKFPTDLSIQADLEILLSDVYLTLYHHIQLGRTNLQKSDPDWYIRSDFKPNQDLFALEKLGSSNPFSLLKQLLPHSIDYQRLKTALQNLLEIRKNGGWPTLSRKKNLKLNDRGKEVAQLKKRLQISGDFHVFPEEKNSLHSTNFDRSLQASLKYFQQRHGLNPSGQLDNATLNELNVSVSTRIRQIQVNLERWRWLPRTLPKNYIWVNTAAFRLDAVENSETMLSMNVVVGKEFRETPSFQSALEKVVLNPHWYVPQKLLIEDILPELKKKPEAYVERGFHFFKRTDSETLEVDPTKENWKAVDEANNFPYFAIQDPGPSNSLGRIKFPLSNPFSIYLHDTPSKKLFRKRVRTFSSGCIRLENPKALALYSLRAPSDAQIAETIQKGLTLNEEITLKPERPIPVFLVYFTSWVDQGGTLHFRPDIYGRDQKIVLGLSQP